ncbi:MAG: hypothetical protein RL215_819 [Planctomycetota bacterium]
MRLASIDVLRTVAIVIMVVVHFLENLSGVRDWSPDGFGAPLFAFLTGASTRLWATARSQRGTPSQHITLVLVRRGLFLFTLGLTFNLLIWLPDDLWTWDVLTFLGTASLLLAAIRHMPTAAAILCAALAALISPALQQIAWYHEWWANGYYEPGETLSEICLGFLVVGYFPLFPWIALPITGYLAAAPLTSPARPKSNPPPNADPNLRSNKHRPTTPQRPVLLAAFGLISVSIALLLVGTQSPSALLRWTMFPASLPYLTGMTGITILLLFACHHWLDQASAKPLPIPGLRTAALFSRYSLTLYLLHHAVHIWPLWLAGLWLNGEPTALWAQALNWKLSLALACVFLAVTPTLLAAFDRRRIPTIETLMRWLCEDSPTAAQHRTRHFQE